MGKTMIILGFVLLSSQLSSIFGQQYSSQILQGVANSDFFSPSGSNIYNTFNGYSTNPYPSNNPVYYYPNVFSSSSDSAIVSDRSNSCNPVVVTSGDYFNLPAFDAFTNPAVISAGDGVLSQYGYGSTPLEVASGNQRATFFGAYSNPTVLVAGDSNNGYYQTGATVNAYVAGDSVIGYFAPGAGPILALETGQGNQNYYNVQYI